MSNLSIPEERKSMLLHEEFGELPLSECTLSDIVAALLHRIDALERRVDHLGDRNG